ncbi:MAG: PD40 domain-containing protein [Bauldia sp.]|nr:PD40 domain-containing protein [Bauldia sp.]
MRKKSFVVALLGAALVPAVSSAVEVPVGTIVMTSNRDGQYDVYRLTDDDRQFVNLTNTPHNEFDPAVSPDGTRIVYSSFGGPVANIWIMNVDGTDARPIVADPPFRMWQPEWSADGTRIVFTGRLPEGHSDIYSMNVDGTDIVQLTFSEEDEYDPVASPDGTTIAFTRGVATGEEDGTYDIWAMDVGGGNERNLTEGDGNELHPEYSPDGTLLTFISNRDGDFDVWVTNSDGTGARIVFDTFEFDEYDPVFSLDGRSIFFTTGLETEEGEGTFHQFVVGLDGYGALQLTYTPDGVFNLHPDPVPNR